jgi:hypothetical protein
MSNSRKTFEFWAATKPVAAGEITEHDITELKKDVAMFAREAEEWKKKAWELALKTPQTSGIPVVDKERLAHILREAQSSFHSFGAVDDDLITVLEAEAMIEALSPYLRTTEPVLSKEQEVAEARAILANNDFLGVEESEHRLNEALNRQPVERTAFERWCVQNNPKADITRLNTDSYESGWTAAEWAGWKGRAAHGAPEREAVTPTMARAILIGGNHLASAIMAVRDPATLVTYDEALAKVGQPFADLWVAWRAIIDARESLTKIEEQGRRGTL